MVHGALFGVRGEEILQFVRRGLEEVAVGGGVEGFVRPVSVSCAKLSA
ncbi:hypothetical protein AB0C13_04830 [Streptomyces sp. NPDC049099]